MERFRFMKMDIWKEAVELNNVLFDLADNFTESKSFRVAEQLRAASLSISNNIAEGSGSNSDKEFAVFLNYVHRSIFETANIVIIANQRGYINRNQTDVFLERFEILSRKISNFRKSILIQTS